MLHADKENLKTAVAQDLLRVREKEMKFYSRNLSMVGTHAALLAGFAFTILSQYEFKTPVEGFLSYESERALALWPEDEAQAPDDALLRTGMAKWKWNTWLQQIFQLAHLLFTTLGMCVRARARAAAARVRSTPARALRALCARRPRPP